MSRIKGINPKVAEIGKIKIGRHSEKKTQSGYNLPQRLDHFIITTTEKDRAKVNFLLDTQVMESLGTSEPKEIPILLPFDDVDLNFQTSFAMYQGRRCVCRGDGETATMTFLKDGKPANYTLLDTDKEGDSVQKDTRRKIICNPETCPNMQPDAKGATRCKPNGRLCTVIPASKRLNGYFFFRTTSYNTIAFILKALDDMKEQSGGILKGIPMKLFFFKKNTDSHGNVPVVSIDWDFDQIDKFRQAVIQERQYRLDYGINIKQLEDKARVSGILDDHDDPEDVVKEFYPETTPENIKHTNKIKKDIGSRADSVLDGVDKKDAEDVEVETIEEGMEDWKNRMAKEANEPEKAAETVKDYPAYPDDQKEPDKSKLSLF